MAARWALNGCSLVLFLLPNDVEVEHSQRVNWLFLCSDRVVNEATAMPRIIDVWCADGVCGTRCVARSRDGVRHSVRILLAADHRARRRA